MSQALRELLGLRERPELLGLRERPELLGYAWPRGRARRSIITSLLNAKLQKFDPSFVQF